MSSKSDRDNRSNQLNPNNASYYSSRRTRDDDDCEGGGNGQGALAEIKEHFAREILRAEDRENSSPVVESFLLNALTFAGDVLHGEFRVRLPNALFSGLRISSCGDVALHYGWSLLRRAFPDLQSEVACLRIRRLDGRDVWGASYSYLPKEPDSFYDAPDLFDNKQRLNALWFEGVRDQCEEFNRKLDQGELVGGEYLGMLLVDTKHQLGYLPSTTNPDQIPTKFSFRSRLVDDVLEGYV
ncbi:MAG: hypothetical protein F9K30_20160 [Dechloromonas sp.]|nr:MAG: hypothetical protein F9K30_20160 [Dechloromonas sp.]